MRISKAGRSTKATSLLTSKNSGDIQIYTGSPPATVDAAPAGTLLVTFSIPVTAGTILNGVFTAAAIADAAAAAAGTAAWYRQRNSGGTTMQDGSVTATGGGGDMIIDNVIIANLQNIRFISWTETEGNPD